MSRKLVFSFVLLSFLSVGSGAAMADEHAKRQWIDISKDKNKFDKNCDYKVWVLEDNKWNETWYLEAFDAENAFYTISRQSTVWHDEDAFYALNYQDKSKFLIGEKHVDVRTFSLCLGAE